MAPLNKVQDLFNVNGQVVVITGGGSGLGLYAARALDANGAKAVYIIGRREETLRDAAKTGVNGTIKYIVGDVSDLESLKKVADQVRQEQGFINLLFCNAGITGPARFASLLSGSGTPSVKEFQDAMLKTDQTQFTDTFHVNTTGVYYTVATFLDLLAAGNEKRNVSQDSQVLVTSSIAGFNRVVAANFAYNASKAAVTHLVKTLATAFARNGFHIRANVIAPGLYPSEMTASTTSKLKKFEPIPEHDYAFNGAYAMDPEQSPAERTGSEQDIAGTILFLASAAGAYLNGETLITDGGRLATTPATY